MGSSIILKVSIKVLEWQLLIIAAELLSPDCSETEGRPSYNQDCFLELSRMPASDNEQIFGKRDASSIDIALTVRYADRKRSFYPVF